MVGFYRMLSHGFSCGGCVDIDQRVEQNKQDEPKTDFVSATRYSGYSTLFKYLLANRNVLRWCPVSVDTT